MSEYFAELNVKVNRAEAEGELSQLLQSVTQTVERLQARLANGLGGAGNPFGDMFNKSASILNKFTTDVSSAVGQIKRDIASTGTTTNPLGKALSTGVAEAKRQLVDLAAEQARAVRTPAEANSLLAYYRELSRVIKDVATAERDTHSGQIGRKGTGNLLGANSSINSLTSNATASNLESTFLKNLPEGVRASKVALDALTKDLQRLTETATAAGGAVTGEASAELRKIRASLVAAAKDPNSPLNGSVSYSNNRIKVAGGDGNLYNVGTGGRVSATTSDEALEQIKKQRVETERAAAAQLEASLPAQRAADAARVSATEASTQVIQKTTQQAERDAARDAEARRKMVESMENTARRAKAWDDRLGGGATQVKGTQYAFSPAAGGFVNMNSGALAGFHEAISLTERLGQQMHQLAAAEKSAADGLGTNFVNGFFGAGGRKYSGGARPISDLNPLAGFGETAGIVAKYSLQGQAIQAISGFLVDSVKGYADLDRATREYETVTGDANGASGSFLGNLEDISIAAGIDVVAALDAATRGVAAFSKSTDSLGDKQQIAQSFVQAVTTNAAITNQTPDASATDIIATGKSFGIAAEGLDSINNAIANARQSFGSDSASVSQALQLFADTGKEAGYSLTELAQVIGLVQAKTGESGTALAGSLQRIFAQFSGQAGKQALEVAGVDPNGTVKDQIESLAEKWDTLTGAQRQNVEAHLGGARALRDLLPLLEDNADLQRSFSEALKNGDAGSRQYRAEIDSLAGQLRQFGALVKQIAINVANSGVLTPLILAFEALKPALTIINNMLKLWSALPTPIKATAGALLAIVEAYKLMAAARTAAAVGDTSGLAGFVGRFTAAAKNRDAALSGVGVKSVGELDAAVASMTKSLETGAQLIAAAEARVAQVQELGAEEIAAANAELVKAQTIAAELQRQASARFSAAMGGGEVAAAGAVGSGAGVAAAGAAEVTDSSILLRRAWAEAAVSAGEFATVSEALAAAGEKTAIVMDVAGAELAASMEKAAAEGALAGTAMTEALERTAIEMNVGAKLLNTSFKDLVAGIFVGRTETQGALDGLAAAIAGSAAKITAIGSVAAAEQVGTAVASTLTGRVGSAFSRAGTGLANLTSFGAGAKPVNLLGGGAITGALAVAYGTAETIGAQRRLTGAQDSAVGVLTDSYNAHSASELKSAAEALGSASEKIKSSTGGLFGSLGGEIADMRGNIGSFFTGGVYESGKNKSARLTRTAEEDNREAQALEKTQKELNASGRLDFSAVDGVSNGLKDMAAHGADARDQLRALTSSIEEFANAANNGGRTFTTASAVTGPKDIAFALRDNILLQNENTQFSNGKLNNLDQGAFTTGVEGDIKSAFASLNIGAGSTVSRDQIRQLEDVAVKSMKDNLGLTAEQYANLNEEFRKRLEGAARGSVQHFILNLSNSKGEFTKDNIDAALAAAPQLAQGAQQETSSVFSLHGTGVAGIEGANARIEALQKIRSAAVNLGKSDEELHAIDNEIVSAQLSLQQATIAHLDAMAALAESMISPDNKPAQIAQRITDLQAKLAATTDSDTRTQLEAQMNQLLQQQAQTDLEEANLVRTSNVAVGDNVGAALAAVRNAQATLDELKTSNASPGVLADAQKKLSESQLEYANQQNESLNSQRVAGTDPRNKTALAQQALAHAMQHVIDLRKAGLGTGDKEYDDAVTAVNQANQNYEDTFRDTKNAKTSNVDSRKSVQAAKAQVAVAKRNLDAALQGQGDYETAQRAYNDALLNLAQKRAEKSSAERAAATDPRDAVKVAQNALRDAQDKLDLSAKGTDGYYQAQAEVKQKKLDLAARERELAAAQRDAGVFNGSSVQAATAELANAEAALKADKKNTADYYRDLKRVHDAQKALADSIIEFQHNQRLLALDMTDPVATAEEDARLARNKLAKDKKKKAPADVIAADQVDVRQKDAAAEKAAFEQRLGDARTNFDLGRTTQAAYLQYLQSEHNRLAAIKDRTRQQQDELNEVDSALKSLTDSSQGQFNLGSITLPTVYEVRRVMAARGAEVSGAITTSLQEAFGTGATSGPIGSLNSVIDSIRTDTAVQNLNNLISAINDVAGAAGGGSGDTAKQAAQAAYQDAQARLASTAVGSRDYYAAMKDVTDAQKNLMSLTTASASTTGPKQTNTSVYGDISDLGVRPIIELNGQLNMLNNKLSGSAASAGSNSVVHNETKIEINGADFARVIQVLNERLGPTAMQASTTSTRKVYS